MLWKHTSDIHLYYLLETYAALYIERDAVIVALLPHALLPRCSSGWETRAYMGEGRCDLGS